MILTVKIDAGMEFAQEVKEILAMRVEPLGVCRVIRIDDDGYGAQIGMNHLSQQDARSPVGRAKGAAAGKERIATPVCALARNDEKARGPERKTQEIPGLGGPYDESLRYCYELMERRKKEAARNG